MNHTYNIKLIGQNLNTQLPELIEKRTLIHDPHSPPISGCAGADIYRLRFPEDLTIADDFGVAIAGKLLQANLFRLPSWASNALLEGGEIASYEATHDLISALLRPMTAEEKRLWIAQLQATVKRGRMTGTVHHSAYTQGGGSARWVRGATKVCAAPERAQTGAGTWTLSLSFDRDESPTGLGERVGAMGLDVGRDPLVVTASADALWRTDGIESVRLSEDELRQMMGNKRDAHLAKRLHHLAHTVAAKHRYEAALEQLKQASSISVEALNMGGMTPGFQQVAHALALQDFMLAWLPQMAHQHHIPLVRVDPYLSSQTCHRCLQRGTRSQDNRTFVCRTHGAMDADENAAHVIRQLGMGATLGRLKERAQTARK